MEWIYDDGGRRAAGFQGSAGDCAVRSAAIVTGRPYREVYDVAQGIARGKRKNIGKHSVRNGTTKATTRKLMEALGLEWTPTMFIGSGCQIHLRAAELPEGRIVVSTSKHITAVLDGVIHDTHDPSRNGTRCVYGYWAAV